jgi:molecular chaperone GrpE
MGDDDTRPGSEAGPESEETVDLESLTSEAGDGVSGGEADDASAGEGGAGGAETPEQTPAETVETLKAQLEGQRDHYLRLMAEFDNYKRRVARDYDRTVEQANERLMRDIIDVRESLERALATDVEGAEARHFHEGMKLILAKLDDVLVKHGMSLFAEEGEVFDPETHDALMRANHETVAADHIAQVYEKGYRLRNRVIRHAKVIVSGGPAPSEGRPAQEADDRD